MISSDCISSLSSHLSNLVLEINDVHPEVVNILILNHINELILSRFHTHFNPLANDIGTLEVASSEFHIKFLVQHMSLGFILIVKNNTISVSEHVERDTNLVHTRASVHLLSLLDSLLNHVTSSLLETCEHLEANTGWKISYHINNNILLAWHNGDSGFRFD
jgi:hypothetical protein